MFLYLYAGRQTGGIVVRMNGYASLYDYRTAIKFFGDEMNTGPVLFITRIQCPLMGLQALVAGQERVTDMSRFL